MKLPFKINLKGKVAAITGGGGVLCGSFAEALAQCGAKIAVLDINKDKADIIAEKICQNEGQSIGLQVDVLDKNSLIAAEKSISEKLGKVNILINGAGGNHPKGTTSREFFYAEDLKGDQDLITFFDLDPKGIEFVFNLNFIGTLLPTQIFARKMVENLDGTIINISSMNAFCPLTKIPAYSGAKASVSNFTQWLAVHFSKVGIRVNAMAPGFFLTEQNRKLLINEDGTFTERANKIISQTPMERFGNPDDLIGTLLWLVDKSASGFVNGVVVPIDGGFSAYSGV